MKGFWRLEDERERQVFFAICGRWFGDHNRGLRGQRQRRRRESATADHLHSFDRFDYSGKRGGDHGDSGRHYSVRERYNVVLADLRCGNIGDADGTGHSEREPVWVVDRMHHSEHGDLHDHGKCECDRDGELYRAGGYVDHSDAHNARDHRDVAAVYGNGGGDRSLYERRYVVSGPADGK
jgi:hypothetical protein